MSEKGNSDKPKKSKSELKEVVSTELREKYQAASTQIASVFKKQPKSAGSSAITSQPLLTPSVASNKPFDEPITVTEEMWERHRKVRTQVAQLTSQLSDRMTELEDTQKKLQESREEYETEHKEKVDLSRQVKNLVEKLSSLESQRATDDKQHTDDQAKITFLEKKVRMYMKNQKAMDKLVQDNETVVKELNILKQENDELKAKQNAIKEEHKEEMQILSLQLKTAQENLIGMKRDKSEELEKVQGELDKQREKLENSKMLENEKMKELFNKIEELEKLVETKEEAEKQLSEQLRLHSITTATIHNQGEDQRTILDLQAEVKEAKTREEKAASRIADLEQNLAMLIQKLSVSHEDQSVSPMPSLTRESQRHKEEMELKRKDELETCKDTILDASQIGQLWEISANVMQQMNMLFGRLQETSMRTINRKLQTPFDVHALVQISNDSIADIEKELDELKNLHAENRAICLLCEALLEVADLRVIENEYVLSYYEKMQKTAAKQTYHGQEKYSNSSRNGKRNRISYLYGWLPFNKL